MDGPSDSRRTFLRTAGAAALLAGSGVAVVAQDDDAGDERGVATFALGGQVPGWEGLAPDPIAGETNPTLRLEAGETYRVVWRNEDGVPHNFAILDETGETMQVLLVPVVTRERAAALFNATGETLRTGEDFAVVGRATPTEPVETPTEPGKTETETGTPTETETETEPVETPTETETETEPAGTPTETETETPTETETETEPAGTPTETETGDDRGATPTATPPALTTVSETIVTEGAIQAVAFEASEEMARYQCQIHPATMVGDLEVSADDEDA